ncbi:unnamed protein product, partial [Mesorhabditis spiculigera]
MADEEASRSAPSEPNEEDEDFEAQDDGVDDEGTMDEEEAFYGEEADDELAALEEEGDLDIEELRKRYGYGADFECEENGEASTSTALEEPSDSPDPPVASSSTMRLLNFYDHGDQQDEEEDKDYVPYDKREVRIDPVLYQITVPKETLPNGTPVDDYPCTTLWKPSENLADDQLLLIQERMRAKDASIPLENCSATLAVMDAPGDNEDLLYTLHKVDNNGNKAVQEAAENRIRHANLPTFTWSRTYPVDGSFDHTVVLDETETQEFEAGFHEFGKDFYQIQKNKLGKRKLGELVEFYYRSWKKSGRYDKFVHRKRIGGEREELKDIKEAIHHQLNTIGRSRRAREVESAGARTGGE